jgi:hypothetical protein
MDRYGLTLDVTTQGFSPTAFDGTRGTTYGHSGEDAAGKPLSAGAKQCSDILVGAGLEPITNQMGADGLVIATCDAFFLWLNAMAHTPRNPTRADVVAAVPQVGENPLATFALRAVYAAGKYEGGDAYALVEWRGSCTCWVQIRDPEPARV